MDENDHEIAHFRIVARNGKTRGIPGKLAIHHGHLTARELFERPSLAVRRANKLICEQSENAFSVSDNKKVGNPAPPYSGVIQHGRATKLTRVCDFLLRTSLLYIGQRPLGAGWSYPLSFR
jgi:hypothetical protein